MKKTVAIRLYRLLLKYYPQDFRRRFGEEMLWVFENCAEHESVTRLLWDGVISVSRQRFLVQYAMEETQPSSYCDLSARRPAFVSFVVAALLASSFLMAMRLLVKPFTISADADSTSYSHRRNYYPSCRGEKADSSAFEKHARVRTHRVLGIQKESAR